MLETTLRPAARLPLGAASLAVTTMLLLSGCSWVLDDEGVIQDRRDEYREAREVRPVDVPADLDADFIRDTMFIPEVGNMERYRAIEEYELPRPATLFTREEERGVRIQRFSGGTWVVAPDAPGAVWPRVLQFLSDNGIPLESRDVETGVIETRWMSVEDIDYRDVVRSTIAQSPDFAPWQRMQLRIESAVRRGSAEVHVIQEGAQRIQANMAWPQQSTTPDLAQQLLARLAEYLAAEVGRGNVSFVGQNIETQPKAEILRPSSQEPSLRLRLGFERAWATLEGALDNAEITVENKDSSARTMQIFYNEAQFRGEEPGYLSRLFDFGSWNPDEKGDPYMLRLAPSDDGFDVFVMEEEPGDVDRETSEQILSVLREFAS